jgi:hypothetical protein
MTTARTDPRPLSVGVSLGILLMAFIVFMRAGADQSFGPLDLDTADRLALALWVAAPVAGGLVARGCANREVTRAALSVGLVVGLVVALFPASGTGQVAPGADERLLDGFVRPVWIADDQASCRKQSVDVRRGDRLPRVLIAGSSTVEVLNPHALSPMWGAPWAACGGMSTSMTGSGEVEFKLEREDVRGQCRTR